jgi:threonine/homoserine/homoserine lactone efflux protein
VTSADIPQLWRRGQEGWPRRFVLVQLPNPPLLVALAASVVGRFARGDAAAYADATGRLALAVFAYLELVDGANWLRRLLGATILAYLVYTLGHALR